MIPTFDSIECVPHLAELALGPIQIPLPVCEPGEVVPTHQRPDIVVALHPAVGIADDGVLGLCPIDLSLIE